MEAICQVQALGMCTTQEAQVIANKYGKTLISIMTAAGLTSKATWAESVWNLHLAWYVHANPKASGEHMKDYYSRQAKHYEHHKDEEYPQLWVEISTIMKYKVLDSAASVSLPNFMALSQVSYDWALALKPQESRCDCNCHVLPVVFMHKLHKSELELD
ncbi:hypothetical protein F5141DRAFT_1221319 [Pisolithus sp. B1]|nr:hypothetical protein F5141DRAFT_1221319 [Pisolithus sp. B1]